MNKTEKSSIFKTSLLVALIGTALGAQAAGLGKLMVYSAIGEPLNAEVALTATPDELNGLAAKLAPHSAFTEAGIEFMPALTGLRFNVGKTSDGRPVLRLTTDAPLNEPFLHFLVELSWTSGRMVREYTFLLDPPEALQVARPASVTPVAPPAMPVSRTGERLSASVTPAPAGSVAAAGEVGEVKVKPGDTLSKIAREHKSGAVTLDQMLVALFNSNREVFDGNNMNRLRAGKILRLPEPEEVAAVDTGEARKLIVSQARDFNAYKRRLAEAAAAAHVADATPAKEAAGKIKPEVEAKAPSPDVKDKLEVSRTETAKSAKGETGKSSLEEDLIARDKALREAGERIAYLEKNLENLKTLVELKSQAGAQMQQQAQATTPAKAVEEKKPEPPPATKPVEAEEKPAAEPAKPAEPAPAPAKPAPKPATPKKPVPPPPPPPEPSFVEENPELVFGGGGIVALLLGYLGFAAWRKKKKARAAVELDERSGLSGGEVAAKSGPVFGATSESVDSGEVSIQGDFSEGGVLTTEESVDPVAEADVLMAYGRDGQAEEILKEGLKSDPTRAAIHLKLLELYANRKSAEQFESVAKDLHALNNGQGSDWDKAKLLARGLGLSGGLFPAAPAVTAAEEILREAEAVAEAAAPEAAIAQKPAEAAIPEVSPPEAVREVASETVAESGSLDFDLDLGTTSSAAVEQAEAKAVPEAEEAMGLDFDFDLGAPSDQAEEASAAAPEPALPAAAQVASSPDGIDFNLDLGSGDEVAEIPAPQLAKSEPSAIPSGAAGVDGLDVDFDLELDSAPVAGPAVANEPALPQTPGLAEIDLSLDAEEVSPVEVDVAAAAESSVVPDDPEVATKLELAQAYEEMGDREGARELLNEVLSEGSPAQQAQARARLDQLET